MHATIVVVSCAALLLAGCNDGVNQLYAPEPDVAYAGIADAAADEAAPQTRFGLQEAMSPGLFGQDGFSIQSAAATAQSQASAGNRSEGGAAAPVQPADATQIAYSYSYGFRVEADRIEQLQQSHAALCEEMGPRRCRVLNLSRAASDDEGYGSLRLQVAANEARAFGTALGKAAEEIDGEQVSFGIDGEDLTETIIDTEAHLGSRRLLRERLMEVLRTRQGSVADLVAAERAVAEVNEEIDSAASRLAELRNRVRMSAVSINYGPDLVAGSGGFTGPIGSALGSVGTTLGVTIAAIVYIAVALVPITAFLLLLRWLWRRSGLRIRRDRKAEPTEAAA